MGRAYTHDDRAVIQLHSIDGLGNKSLLFLLQKYTPCDLLAKVLQKDVKDVRGKSIGQPQVSQSQAEDLIRLCEREDTKIVSIRDETYPEPLRQLYEPPAILYVKGELNLMCRVLGVVGTRKYTRYGKSTATQFIKDVAQTGVAIVSGMAIGIDALAHEACLGVGGYTVAVLGSGVDVPSPRQNIGLYNKIIQSGGVIISEFPLGFAPTKYSFPRRNRLIAGLSEALLVIEAGASSGSLITAREALDQGKDVMAVPGEIYSAASQGTNHLIQNGAHVVTSATDILELLQVKTSATRSNIVLDDGLEQSIYEYVQQHGGLVDSLLEEIDEENPRILSALTALEIKGVIQREGEMVYAV